MDKSSKILQSFFDSIYEAYNVKERYSVETELLKFQPQIKEWIDKGLEWSNKYEEVKNIFLLKTKWVYNKKLLEKEFSRLWLDYSPKEIKKWK